MEQFKRYYKTAEIYKKLDDFYGDTWKNNHPIEMISDNKIKVICATWTRETEVNLNKLPKGHPCPHCKQQKKD